MSKREVEFYDCSDDCEHLSHDNVDDAVEECLDNYPLGPLPGSVTVYHFARTVLDKKHLAKLAGGEYLERIVEWLDEDYGPPDAPSKPSPAMEVAEAAFIDAVLANYVPWTCEVVGEEEVNVEEWCKKNRPGWLEEQKKGALP